MPLLVLAVLAAGLAGPAPSGPTLAIEDTMHTEVAPVLVRAPRVTLGPVGFRASCSRWFSAMAPASPRCIGVRTWICSLGSSPNRSGIRWVTM